MLAFLYQTLLFLQPDAVPAGGEAAPSGAAPAPGGCTDPSILVMVALFGVMYFALIRPQQKRQKEHEKMVKALEKGDVVRTDGGIKGEIVSLDERDVTLLVDHKTKLTVLRNRIAGPEASPEAETAKGATGEAGKKGG